MVRPKKLIVAKFDIAIEWPSKMVNFGEFNSDLLKIRIRSKLSRDSARHVLWHEVKHAIWWAYGINPDLNDLEESIINSTSGPELEVLMNNPCVARYIFSEEE